MKIKLKSKDTPMKILYCFNRQGFCQTTFDKINSGVQVEVERVPSKAWEYVEEVKPEVKKEKPKKVKKEGDK